MNREIYKRVAPHLDRTKQDGGVPTDNMSDLFLLQRSNEQYKDYLKLSFCPELHGYKKDTRSNVDYITKGYSANSINNENVVEQVSNGKFDTDYSGWSVQNGTLLIENGTLKVTTTNGANGDGCGYFPVNLISGKTYKLNVDVSNSNGVSNCSIRTGIISGSIIEEPSWSSTNRRVELIFKANKTTIAYINLATSNTTSNYAHFDNVSFGEYLINDLTQTSSANQPYLDKIAPAEKLSAKNPNGGSNYLTHPDITFQNSTDYTIEIVLRYDGVSSVRDGLFGGDGTLEGLRLNKNNNTFELYTNNGSTLSQINYNDKYNGKTYTYTFVVKNNTLYYYVDGKYINSYIIGNTKITFNTLLKCRGENFYPYIYLYSYHILSKALSASEVAERTSILRSIFPEIPFTRIGDQIWSVRNFEATVTPQGNLIPEMQTNGNVEKITNGSFDSDTVWNKSDGTITIPIPSGVLRFINSNGFAYQSIITGGKYYKIKYTISNYVSGNIRIYAGDSSMGIIRSSNGTYTEYIKSNGNSNFYLYAGTNTTLDLDNVSVQEIGWSGSQELYDGIFNQRKVAGDTDEQATYAAVKAAAMWCHYGNDVALGAIYGKLYNWFAVKLLQMDIDYYNANNPSTPWGWRVPTQADFNTLATTLGGASVAGAKIKTNNAFYFEAKGTNISGFTSIGAGYRDQDHLLPPFGALNSSAFYRVIEPNVILYNDSDNGLQTGSWGSRYGFSLRLIKA